MDWAKSTARGDWNHLTFGNLVWLILEVLWYWCLSVCVCMYVSDILQYCINGLVQERRNSIANALELRLSCTNPSVYSSTTKIDHGPEVTITKTTTYLPLICPRPSDVAEITTKYGVSPIIYQQRVKSTVFHWNVSWNIATALELSELQGGVSKTLMSS